MAEVAGIVLCGGEGKRLRELTGDDDPKSLFKVNGLPLIEYTIAALEKAGIAKVLFAVGYKKERIIDWVEERDPSFGRDYIEQATPGVIGAITSCVEGYTSKSYIACNSDEIRLNFRCDDMVAFHESHGYPSTICGVESADLYRHRVLRCEGIKVLGSQLKDGVYQGNAQLTGIVNTGVVIFDREILYLSNPEVYGNDWSAIINPLHDTGNMALYRMQGKYYNVGTPQEFLEADREVNLHLQSLPAA